MFLKRLQVVVLVSGIALPMMMGQGCPVADSSPALPPNPGGVQGAQPTTLLTNTRTSFVGGWIFAGTFNPTSAGKVISVNVEGNTTGSRPHVRVFDAQFNIVAQELFPVTNVTSLSFTSTSTGDHHIYAFETGTPASLYTITAVQQP
mgnify:CR=1 FL=1